MPDHDENDHANHSHPAAGEGSATCPVCNMDLDVTEETPKLDHGGETYYFCNDDCRDDFEADPVRYVSRP